MRLSQEEVDLLKNLILDCRPKAQIFLFGSRANDQARGGDIDILILDSKKLTLEEMTEIEKSFWSVFGEQKIDLVCFTPDSDHPFKKVALLTAIPLNERETST
jgi:predicted nucleotidyltransferase